MTDRKGTVVRSVVSKAAVILLSFRDGASYSLTEIVNVTGLPRSTAYRLICELVTWRMLERVDDGGYRLGLSLRLIGMRATDVRNDLQACAPVVLQERKNYNDPADLANAVFIRPEPAKSEYLDNAVEPVDWPRPAQPPPARTARPWLPGEKPMIHRHRHRRASGR